MYALTDYAYIAITIIIYLGNYPIEYQNYPPCSLRLRPSGKLLLLAHILIYMTCITLIPSTSKSLLEIT